MKLLIIEDEHKIANSLKKGFDQEGFTVKVAYDGLDGLDMAIEDSYDVLILDRMLPGMDGMEICSKLREKGNHIPILMLTAKGQLYEKVEGLNSGADDYLTKPFAFEELLARVRALSRRPRKALASVLSFDDLTLDTVTYTVQRLGQEIKLTSKEFSLLEYLLRHQGQTVSKDQIISHVWDYDSDILPNTVEAFIKSLRSKIDKPFPNSSPLIHTIRGFGYRLGEIV